MRWRLSLYDTFHALMDITKYKIIINYKIDSYETDMIKIIINHQRLTKVRLFLAMSLSK
jgi:hypothetical protein